MKKLVTILVLCLTCVFCAIGFTACSISNSGNSVDKDTKTEQNADNSENNNSDSNTDGDNTPQTIYYNVTFVLDGGSNVSSQIVEKDGKATKPNDPTKDGYNFIGWYKDFALKSEWNFSTDKVTANITLYAKWEPITVENNSDNDANAEEQGNAENGTTQSENNDDNGNNYDDDDMQSELPPTAYERFDFTLLDDDTYEIKVKNKNDLPAKVSIPSMHNGKPVTSIGEFAFFDYEELEKNFDNISSEEEIFAYACLSLTDIIIPNSVTSIGDYAFCGCSSLTSITIPDSVTSIGDFAFSSCSSLTSITIPDSVTSIGSYAFCNCNSLQYNEYDNGYYLGNTNNPYLILIKTKSTDITSCTIHNDTKFIAGDAFDGCSSLTSVTIGNSVTSIGILTFYDCSSLKVVTISDSVMSIGEYAFVNCNSLTTVYYTGTAEEWNTIEIDSVYNTHLINATRYYYSAEYPTKFVANTYWHYVDGKPTVWEEIYNVTPDEYFTFTLLKDDTYSIKAKDKNNMPSNVVLPKNYNGKAVTSIGHGAFYSCKGLASITISDSIKHIEYDAFRECASLTNLTIGNSVTIIDIRAFGNCSSLTSVTIGNGLTNLGRGAFNGCNNLESVTIPFIGSTNNSFGDHYLGYLFGASNENNHASYVPSSLKTVITDDNQLTFYQCNNLTSVTLGDSVTSIGYRQFAECSSLTSVTMSNKVTKLFAYSFYACINLTNITLPTSLQKIEQAAFSGCRSLKNITLPSSLMSIGDSAFSGCSALTSSITIGEHVSNIGNSAFSGCVALTSITIGKNVSSIGKNAFAGCESLSSITIPKSVKSIGDQAFNGCTGLKSITYSGTKTQWNAIEKGIRWKSDVPATTIKCTDGSVNI